VANKDQQEPVKARVNSQNRGGSQHDQQHGAEAQRLELLAGPSVRERVGDLGELEEDQHEGRKYGRQAEGFRADQDVEEQVDPA
jgi:hypothetical protein